VNCCISFPFVSSAAVSGGGLACIHLQQDGSGEAQQGGAAQQHSQQGRAQQGSHAGSQGHHPAGTRTQASPLGSIVCGSQESTTVPLLDDSGLMIIIKMAAKGV
jgi:hypothetical protein